MSSFNPATDFTYEPGSFGNSTFPSWAESFSAPSVAPLTSSPSSTGGGFDWMSMGQGIGMLGEGIGNAFRAFRGEPPMPGGLIQSYMNQQQADKEMQQLKDLFASIGMTTPPLVKPKTEDDEREDKEDEGVKPLTDLEEIDKRAFRLPSSYTGFDFSGAGSTFDSEPGAWGSSSSFPSPRLAGQALSGYFNTGN